MSKQELYKEIHLKVDFGAETSEQIVQETIPQLVQYDNNSGLLVFDFSNNGLRIDMTNTRIVVNFKLPSGDGVHDEVTNVRPSGSRAMYFTPIGILSEVGIVVGDITLYKDDIQITSCAKFKFEVIQGIETDTIVDSDKYPILQGLINKVEEVSDMVVDNLALTETKLEEFDLFMVESNNEFDEQQLTMQQNFNTMIGQQGATFDNKLGEINTTFDQKYQDIDAMFNQNDVDQMFADKFANLETEYAQTYVDVQNTVNEVYNTTLKYRIIE